MLEAGSGSSPRGTTLPLVGIASLSRLPLSLGPFTDTPRAAVGRQRPGRIEALVSGAMQSKRACDQYRCRKRSFAAAAAGRMYSPASSLFICHARTFEMGRAHPLKRSRQSRWSYKLQRYNLQSSYSPPLHPHQPTPYARFVVPMLIHAQRCRSASIVEWIARSVSTCCRAGRRRTAFGATIRAKRALSSRCVFFSVYRRSAVCFGAQ